MSTLIPVNVEIAIEQMAEKIGDHFRSQIVGEIESTGAARRANRAPITSPIEQIFYAALCARCMAEGHNLMELSSTRIKARELPLPGIHLWRQADFVAPYKCDFVLRQSEIYYTDRPIVVELDGHEFHDKNPDQRSYEKARDRQLQEAGAMVLHFTGSDVVRDPFAVVHEVMKYLIGVDEIWPSGKMA